MSLNDEMYMRKALAEAELALAEGEIPVGCVIVKDGAIIARAHNACERMKDATAHAELLAIRRASEALGVQRLTGCTLYVTLEPCPMCAGAIMLARLDRAVYGTPDLAMGCTGSVYRIPEDPVFPHFCLCDGGVLKDECASLLRRAFAKLR